MGVAEKVTAVPALLGLVPAVMAMLTDGATDGLTVTVMVLLLAVLLVTQLELDVNVQVTVWPLVIEVVV